MNPVSFLDDLGDDAATSRTTEDISGRAYQTKEARTVLYPVKFSRLAFEDGSGANSAFCSMCKAPTAIDMIASVCGRGAIMAVEQKLRGKVEFKLKEETMKREASRSNARDMNEHARRIFNELAEKINLKCPRCKAAFHDYDGCNALKCGAPGCNAGFCAICLKDCGNDAHQHIYTVHKGQIFDKGAFERSRIERAQTQIDALKEFSSSPRR